MSTEVLMSTTNFQVFAFQSSVSQFVFNLMCMYNIQCMHCILMHFAYVAFNVFVHSIKRQYVQLNEWKFSHMYMQWFTVMYVDLHFDYATKDKTVHSNKLSFTTYTSIQWIPGQMHHLNHICEHRTHIYVAHCTSYNL